MRYAAKVKKIKKMGRSFYRVVLAHANHEPLPFGRGYGQVFHPRFIIAESGDYLERPAEKSLTKILLGLVRLKKISVNEIEVY